MDKVRVAYIIDELGTGGTERQLKNLIEGLDRSRFLVSLVLLRGVKDHPLKPENVNICYLNITKIFSFSGIRKIFLLSKFFKQEQCQIVQTFFQDATIVGFVAAKWAGTKKIVISVRDMLFWSKPMVLLIHQIIMRWSDAILVNSESVKNKVKQVSRNKRIKIIYNGIITGKEFEKSISANHSVKKEFSIADELPVVVLVSNCNRQVKRVDLLVESIPLVVKEIPAYFLIVGDGWMRPQLEKRAAELKINKCVKFTGSRNDVEKILAGSDIALNTSDSEGFSNSVMEAMRAGLPVVASNVAGNKELVKNGITGMLFEPGNIEDLKEKILYLLTNKDLSNKLGSNGKKTIEKRFDINIIMQQHMDLYESLIKYR